MNATPFILFLSILGFCNGDTFRISEVVPDASEQSETMTLSCAGASQSLHVKKAPVLGDGDVRYAVPNCGLDNDFLISLTDAGAKKLHEVTNGMVWGQDRLAIIMDGKLISAPVVMSPMGGEFTLAGLEGSDPRQRDDLARKISGRPPRPPGVLPPDPNPGVVKIGGKSSRKPPVLPMVYPQIDTSAKDFDRVAFVEAIRIPNPKGAVNVRDLGGFIQTSLALVKCQDADPDAKKSISSNCDFILTLSHHFPDLAALSKTANHGRIPLESFKTAMLPYINGDKTWPLKPETAAPSKGTTPD